MTRSLAIGPLAIFGALAGALAAFRWLRRRREAKLYGSM